MRVATNESWTDKNGEKQERTQWHTVVAFRGLGETCAAYLRKGSQVYVEGRVEHRTFEKTDGTTGYATDTIANTVQFLDRKNTTTDTNPNGVMVTETGGDDLPF